MGHTYASVIVRVYRVDDRMRSSSNYKGAVAAGCSAAEEKQSGFGPFSL
jgi:hypothetical protein